jgi:hypothetical protein
MSHAPSTLAARIVGLAKLPIDELWSLWDQHFARRPDFPNRTYLESRLAYKLQADAHGGLAKETRLRLETIGAKHSKIKRRAAATVFEFAPGTVLSRQWGERTHQVTVTSDGRFEYEGQSFKSLTAVARQITGQHWSGPLFFGLTKEAK